MARPEAITTTGAEVEAKPEQLIFAAGEYSEPLPPGVKGGREDQDRGYVNNISGEAIVADGMGSTTGGETAQLVVDTFRGYVNTEELNGQTEEQVKVAVEAAVRRTAISVKQETANGNLEEGSGSTLAGFIPFKNELGEDCAVIVNVGDSFVIGERNGKVDRLTREETMARDLHDAGEEVPRTVNLEDGQRANPHNVLENALAGHQIVKINQNTVQIVKIKPGDRYVVTSDGIENTIISKLEYPATREWFEQQVADKSLTAQELADKLGTKDADKTDDKLVYVIDIVKEEAAPSPASVEPASGEGDNSSGRRRRAGRGKGRKEKREAARDARAAERANRAAAASNEADDPSSEADPAGSSDPEPAPDDPANPEDGDDSNDGTTPYSKEQQRIMQVEGLRHRLAQMQNKKRWGFLYGVRNRKKMEALRQEYDDAVADLINNQLFEATLNGTLEANYSAVASRRDELLAQEGQHFIDASATSELTRYGDAVRAIGDKLYGEERKLARRLVVSGVIGGLCVGAAAVAPAAAVIAVPGMRIARNVFAGSGVAGHDSEAGTRRVLNKVTSKRQAELEARTTETGQSIDELSPAEQVQLALVQGGSFKETYLDSINKSDTKRRAVSAAGHVAAVAGVLGAGRFVHSLLTDKVSSTGSGMPKAGGAKFTNLSPTQVEQLQEARLSPQMIQDIDNDPERFSRFINSVNTIQERTGLTGTALNERVTHTLALAKDKSAYIEAARGRGISAEVAGAAFDERMAKMVFSDAVKSIQETTGLSGAALLRRVNDTAALAQAKDQFIYQVSDPSEQLARQRMFDENFRRFIEEFEKTQKTA